MFQIIVMNCKAIVNKLVGFSFENIDEGFDFFASIFEYL